MAAVANFSFEKIHGLHWNSGKEKYDRLSYDLEKLSRIKNDMYSLGCIYVKGNSKVKWLRDIAAEFEIPLEDAKNMEELGMPALKQIIHDTPAFTKLNHCPYHNMENYALLNVRVMYDYWIKNGF